MTDWYMELRELVSPVADAEKVELRPCLPVFEALGISNAASAGPPANPWGAPSLALDLSLTDQVIFL